MDGQVRGTVIVEVAGKVASKVIDTIGKRQSVDEKLQRLEMLVIKLRGTVEVSERLGAETASLLQWRDKLTEAASEGSQVLLGFQQRRAADGDTAAAAAAAQGTEGEEHQDGGGRPVVLVKNILLALDRGVRKAAAALLSYSGCAASYTRHTLVGMARGVRSATAALLSCSEGVVKLNSTVDRLEQACADIGQFISLHHAAEAQTSRANNGVVSTRTPESMERVVVDGNGKKDENNTKKINQRRGEPAPAVMRKGSLEEPAAAKSAAAQRLQDALVEISRTVAVADRQGLKNLEWLSDLADVLREDRRAGGEILGTGREIIAARQESAQQLRASDATGSEEEIEPGVNEKLQRLEMLVVKLRSTVEVSMRHGANKATSLLRWRDKLSEAASRGHRVLLNFKRRVMRAGTAATDATTDEGKSGCTVFFVRKALQGMARGVQKSSTATTTLLLAADEGGAVELNNSVSRLEKVCAEDVDDFIRLLQAETSSQVQVMHMPMKRKKLELKTRLDLDRSENMDIIAENVLLQDTSASREDSTRGRRRLVMSSSSGEEDNVGDFWKNRRTRRRLVGSYSSSSSSSIKEGDEAGVDEDGSRSRSTTGLISSSSSSSKGGKEDSQSTWTRIRLTGLFSSSSSPLSLSSPFSLLSSSSSPFSLSSSPLPSSSSPTSEEEEEDCVRRGRSGISSSPNDWVQRRSSLVGVGEEEMEEEEKEEATLMAMARFQAVLAKITKAVEISQSRDLAKFGWLAEWAYILGDARQQGYAINLNGGEQEAEGICNAANILDTLALDVECFVSLVLLCPPILTTKKKY
jgi:hypothetical protein